MVCVCVLFVFVCVNCLSVFVWFVCDVLCGVVWSVVCMVMCLCADLNVLFMCHCDVCVIYRVLLYGVFLFFCVCLCLCVV